MILFIILAVLLTFTVIAIYVFTLRKTPHTSSQGTREAQNITYAKQRLIELEQQRAKQEINPAQFEKLKQELEYTLAIDLAAQNEQKNHSMPRIANTLVLVILCTALPLVALLSYLTTGTPNAIDLQQQLPNIAKANSKKIPQKEILTLIAGVEERLVENPSDAKGWKLLAKTYLAMGQYNKSKAANLRVIELGKANVDTYVQLADAIALQANGIINIEAQSYLQKALEIEANHPQVLWLAGLAQMQNGNSTKARQYWNTLLPLLAAVPEQQQKLQQIIDESHLVYGEDGTQNSALLRIEVSVEPAIQAQLTRAQTTPNTPVFIIARSKDSPGVPVAVKRLNLQDLPATIELSDKDAMIASRTLSNTQHIEIQARLAISASPIAQKGDFQSYPKEVKIKNLETYHLVIDTQVE